MAFVTVRGARFHVVELGVNDLADTRLEHHARPVVVMLHGLFSGSVATWFLTAAPQLARTHRVRLIDWRGHGLSEVASRGYGSASMAADLRELTADLPPFALVGHSYGALVGSRFSLDNPGRVTRLALVEPPVLDGGRPWWTTAESAQARSEAAASDTRRGRVVLKMLDNTEILAELESEPPFTRDDILGLPEVPVLVVSGSESRFCGAAQALASQRPGTQREVLNGRHEVHLDAKRELTELLETFCANPSALAVPHG